MLLNETDIEDECLYLLGLFVCFQISFLMRRIFMVQSFMDTEYLFCGFRISTNKYSLAIRILVLLEVSFRTFYFSGSFSLPLQEESVVFAQRKKCKAALSPEYISTLFLFSMKAGDVMTIPHHCAFSREEVIPRHPQALGLVEA